MYLTQTDLVKLQLQQNRAMNFSETIKEIITDDENSEEKKAMLDGDKYYRVKHDILDHDFRAYFIDGIKHINKNAANNKIVHAYHRILVDQKMSYIVGKPIVFATENEMFQQYLNDLLGNPFHKTMKKWVAGTSNHGIEYLHVYINEKGILDYVIIPGHEIIPIYDTQFQKILIGVIRYYKVEVKERLSDFKKYKYKVEIWNGEKVLFLEEKDNGEFVLDPDKKENPKYHWYRYNTLNPDSKVGEFWGRVPFIPLKNNDEAMTDLQLTKTLIDNYDFNVSDFSNKLMDIAKAIWVLKGYKGTSLSEFVKNLNSYNAMKVEKEGGVDRLTIDIPKEAHDSHLDRIEDNIFIFGMGVNPKIDKFGNSPSGIALKYFYAGLDLKANILITEMIDSLTDFGWFATKYINMISRKNFDSKEIKATFNKSILVNEKEIIDMAQASKGIISDKTIMENHPWVNNVDEEMKRIESETTSINLDNVE